MNSLEESSMEEIKQAIRSEPWLDAYFDIGEKYIRTKNCRISYAFCGLRHNLDSIKSKARILIAWVDEAENVSETAWIKLLPTVRENDSEVWITWNPERDGSATDTRFRKNMPAGAKIVEMNYADNPWFPDVLDQERLNDRQTLDDQTYAWIWDGAYRENSDAQILAGKYRVAESSLVPIGMALTTASTGGSARTRLSASNAGFTTAGFGLSTKPERLDLRTTISLST